MREQLNCPNCGAPIRGCECEYCGTMFYDFATLDQNKPTYVRVKVNNKLFTFNARLTTLSLTSKDSEVGYFDNYPVLFMNPMEYKINLDMDLVPFDKEFNGKEIMYTIQNMEDE